MESLRASRRQSLRATLRSIIENGRPINPHVSMRVLFKSATQRRWQSRLPRFRNGIRVQTWMLETIVILFSDIL